MSDDILADAKEAFELASETESENRIEALDDLRFARLDEHWPETVRKQRELDGRPCLVIPKLPAFIRQVVNDARQNKPAINVHPVDSDADPETAEIFSGLIRNIEQSSDAEVAYDTSLDFAVTMGFGYFKINTRYTHDDGFDQDLCIERVANPFSIFGDPNSTAADSSDWDTAFEIDTMALAAFERRWKGADPTSFDGAEVDKSAAIRDQKVMVASWWTREEATKVIVALSDGQVVDAEIYKANRAVFEGLGLSVVGERSIASHKVKQRVLSGGDVLETVDWAGKYIPIVPVYGEELNIEGKRHFRSLVRSSKDAQRMFNYWRTKATESVALAPIAPFIGPKNAFETDAAKWATANTTPHAYIEYDGGVAPERQPYAGIPAGALQEALNASDDMKAIMGIHDASLGARSNETSGVAIMARQREGDVGSFHFIDNLSRAIKHAGRILVDLIPHVYSVPRVIRTIGPQGEVRAVVAAPKDMQERLPPQVQQAVQKQQEEAAKAEQQADQAKDIARIYDLTAGKYDVTVKVGPSFTSRREEAATQMIELLRAYPDAAPIIGDLLVQNLDWPGADKVSERLAKMLPPQVSGKGNPEAEQVKAQAQQVIQQGAQAMQQLQQQLAQTTQENQQLKAANDLKAQENQIKFYAEETKRMQVEQQARLDAARLIADESRAANEAMAENNDSTGDPDEAA